MSAPSPGPAALWGGRTLSVLVAAMMLMSATMKLSGSPELAEGMAHLGIPSAQLTTLAAIEIACVVLYLIPYTALIGAILLAAYLGGATSIHLRVGDPVIMPIAIGVVAWLGLWLREPRLRPLAPLRSL